MHAEIAITQARVFELFHKQRAYLASKPRALVEELLHRSEELVHASDFSVRTAAEINRAACVFALHWEDAPQPKGKL